MEQPQNEYQVFASQNGLPRAYSELKVQDLDQSPMDPHYNQGSSKHGDSAFPETPLVTDLTLQLHTGSKEPSESPKSND